MTRLVSIFLIMCSLFFVGCQGSEPEAPKAKKGVLDLSTYTFGEEDTVKLDGEWEFFWNQYLSPEDFINDSESENALTGHIHVPGNWSNSINDKILPERGFGTYRLLVKTHAENMGLGIKTTNIKFEYKIFIDGIEQNSHTGQQTDPNSIPHVIFFENQNDAIEIIIQTVNHEDVNGGILQSIYLGSDKAILKKNMQLLVMDMIIITCMFMLFFLLLIIFIAIGAERKNNFLIFVLGISCFFYGIVNSGMREKLLFQFMPWIPTEMLYKIIDFGSIGYFISNLILLFFIERELFPQILVKSMQSLFILQGIIVFFCPLEIYTIFFEEILLIDLLTIVICDFCLLRSVLKKSKQNVLGKMLISFMTVIFILPLLNIINMRIRFFQIDVTTYFIIGNICLFIFIVTIASFIVHGTFNHNIMISKMSERLFVLDQLKNEFIICTSQQFKAPLNSILYISESLIKECSLCSRQEQNLSFIISISKKLTKLVDDIQDLIKLKSDEIILSISSVDIKARISAVAEVLKILIQKKEISVIINIPDDLPNAKGDENRIYQILNNLTLNTVNIINAGKIEIYASSYHEYIYVTVLGEDNNFFTNKGSENLFTQTSDFLHSDLERINIGLSISKKLAEMMGGTLETEYMIEGKGCKYILKLPIFQCSDKERDSTSDIEALKKLEELSSGVIDLPLECTFVGRYNALVVDDDISNIHILIKVLTKEGYNVYSERNGYNALKRLEEGDKFDIVILDATMSGISGYDVCRKIREEYSMLQLPILITTSVKSPDYIRIGYEAGSNDIILKPFELTELKARVRAVLTQRKLVEEALENEIAFLQSQIKPHFLHNAISNIIAICYEDGEKAGEMLATLSTYLKSIFRNSKTDHIIPLEQELEIIHSYVEIERLRLGDHLCYRSAIDNEVLKSGIQIPALIIQPLIENAIRHGVYPKESPGTVVLSIKRDHNQIRIAVEDDGIGMSDAELKIEAEKKGKGIGLKNVRRRVESLPNASFVIESELMRGTRCSIILTDN